MSGDLEDFLRRAAERRREKAAGPPAPQPRRQRPEYTDSRRERDAEPIEVAETVEDSYEEPDNAMTRAIAAQQRQIREAERQAEKIRSEAKPASRERQSSPGKQKTASDTPAQPSLPASLDELAEILSTPRGLRQAILMKEVLERPEHRW